MATQHLRVRSVTGAKKSSIYSRAREANFPAVVASGRVLRKWLLLLRLLKDALSHNQGVVGVITESQGASTEQQKNDFHHILKYIAF